MSELDLDRLDEALAALGVDLDEPDEADIGEGTRGGAAPLQGDERTGLGHSSFEGGPGAPDPLVDLPAPTAPPGYRLDAGGVLRYCHDGSVVPGQRRVTIARLWRFERRGDSVMVPAMWAAVRDELAWCADMVPAVSSTEVGGVSVAAHPVPADVYDSMAAHQIGVTAPELDVNAMLDVNAVAALSGLTRSAVPTYLARGVLPEPQARVGGSPLWSAPVLGVWLATRRRPGRPRAHAAAGRRDVR